MYLKDCISYITLGNDIESHKIFVENTITVVKKDNSCMLSLNE